MSAPTVEIETAILPRKFARPGMQRIAVTGCAKFVATYIEKRRKQVDPASICARIRLEVTDLAAMDLWARGTCGAEAEAFQLGVYHFGAGLAGPFFRHAALLNKSSGVIQRRRLAVDIGVQGSGLRVLQVYNLHATRLGRHPAAIARIIHDHSFADRAGLSQPAAGRTSQANKADLSRVVLGATSSQARTSKSFQPSPWSQP